MFSIKNLTILLLGLSFLQATLAYSGCEVLLYKNSINDDDQDRMYHYSRSQTSTVAPFYGYNDLSFGEPRTLSSFRVMDLNDCGFCTVTGYSTEAYGGNRQEEYVERVGQVNFEFCVKSYTLECDEELPEEEEEEQPEEYEEMV